MISTQKTIKLALTTFITFLIAQNSYCGMVIRGDQTDAQVFSFPLKTKAYSLENHEFFVGAGQEVANNNFALSKVGADETAFTGITPPQAKVNYVDDQDNPLHGKQIDYLALMSNFPVVITNNDPNHMVYMYFIGTKNTSLITSSVLKDSAGNDAASTAGFTAYGSNTFAAVRPNGGATFGPVGSGINVGQLIVLQKDDNSTEYQLLPKAQAAPLDITTNAIKITSNVASIDNDSQIPAAPLALHFDPQIKKLYTGLLVTGASGAIDGARSITRDGNQDLCPVTCFDNANDYIIGAIGSDVSVCAHYISSLYTTTRLNYLALVGGVGTAAATKRTVFVLPLINDSTNPSYGMLASKNAVPVNDWYTNRTPYKFKARYLQDAATQPSDMYTATDAAALVGGGPVPDDITDVYSEKDTVYVATQMGIYYSQAIFDANGVIKNWTQWQRTAGTASPQYFFSIDTDKSLFYVVSGTDLTTTRGVYRTAWSPQSSSGVTTVSELFPLEQSGIQQCIDFPNNYPGFSQTTGERTARLIATGYKKIIIAQSGSDDAGNNFQAGLNLINYTEYTNGSIVANPTTPTLVVSGGALDELGPIKTATITTTGPAYWLCVAGSKGFAVLAQSNGAGFGAPQKDFGELTTQTTFKKVLDIKNIRKIMAIGDNIFILTSDKLLRTTLSQNAIANNSLTVVDLADAKILGKNAYSSFADMIISEKLALVSSSFGLIRSGNDVTITTAQNQQEASWVPFEFNDSIGSVTQLYPITQTNIPQNFFSDDIDNYSTIYVLSGYVGYDQARIYRLCITPGNQVSNATVQNMPDYILQNSATLTGNPTFFLNSGYYRNHCATDGTFLYMTRSKYEPNAQTTPFVEAIPGDARSGVINAARGRTTIFSAPGARSLENMLHCSGNGTWIAAGDFGLRVNE